MVPRVVRALAASLLLLACTERDEVRPSPSAAPAAPPPTAPDPGDAPRAEEAKQDRGTPGRAEGGSRSRRDVAETVPLPGEAPDPGSAGARPLAAISSAAEGKVGRGELESVVAANLERFRPCATEDATVELEVTVSGGGSVTGVRALRSRPDHAKLRDCVVEAFRGIAFSRGAGSETSTITFELALTRPAF